MPFHKRWDRRKTCRLTYCILSCHSNYCRFLIIADWYTSRCVDVLFITPTHYFVRHSTNPPMYGTNAFSFLPLLSLLLITSRYLRKLYAKNMSRHMQVFFHVSIFVYCLCLVSTTTVRTIYIAHTCYVITTHIFLTLYVCMHADVLAYSHPTSHV